MKELERGVTERSLAPMQQIKPQRGRPKGSGIDDTSRLRQIAALMATDPKIRPTTAIKAIGINDPSAIRRLRDKLTAISRDMTTGGGEHARPITLFSERLAGPGSSAGFRTAATARLLDQIRRTEPLSMTLPVVAPASESAAITERQEFAMSAAHMLAMSLVNMCNMMQHQQTLWSEVVKNPGVALALRQQLMLSEMLLDVLPARATATHDVAPASA
jgi:hypothetical protein